MAQLARAPALQAGGHRFESDYLHQSKPKPNRWFRFFVLKFGQTIAKMCENNL